MNKIKSSIFLFLIVSLSSFGQTDPVQPITGTQGFISYKIFLSHSGVPIKSGSLVKWQIQNYLGDLLQNDTRTSMPVYTQIDSQIIPADYIKIFLKGFKGDSMALSVPVDSVTKGQANATHDGKFGYVYVKVLDVFENKADMDADLAIETKKAAVRDSINSIQQRIIDNKLIDDYVAEKKLQGFKTASGLFVAIKNKGAGGPIKKGDKVNINYTGKTIAGPVFDSNIDPRFGHVTPLEVTVGISNVIQGWHEGLLSLTKGGEGTLIIPSSLAYGKQGNGPAIGPNSILVFDMQVVGTPQATTPQTPKPKPVTKTRPKH